MGLDAYENAAKGVGIVGKDPRLSSVVAEVNEMDEKQLADLYRGQGLARRIVELPPQHMMKKGYDLDIPDDDEAAAQAMQYAQDVCVNKNTTTAMKWARLFGGGALLASIDDGSTDPVQPLNENNIKTINYFMPLGSERIRVCEWYTAYDKSSPRKYGKPKIYELIRITEPGGNVVPFTRFHESRVIPFTFMDVPDEEKQTKFGWGDSALLNVNNTLRDYDMSFQMVNIMLQKAGAMKFKMEGLAKAVASSKDSLIHKRMDVANFYHSALNVLLLDKDGEELEMQVPTFTGLPDVLKMVLYQVSIDTGIPISLLAGVKLGTGGLGDGTADDLVNWYDNIASWQEDVLREGLERIFRMIFLAKDGPTKGLEPENWKITFKPLWEMSAKEQAETRKIVADTDQIYFNIGALGAEEIRDSRWTADGYSPEITKDDAAFNAQAEAQAKQDEELQAEMEKAKAAQGKVNDG